MVEFRAYKGRDDADFIARLMMQDLSKNGASTPFQVIRTGILKKATPRNTFLLGNHGYVRIFDDNKFGFIRFDLAEKHQNNDNQKSIKSKLLDICSHSKKKLRVMLIHNKGWKHLLVTSIGFSPVRYFFEMERTKPETQWKKNDFHQAGLLLEPFSSKLNMRDFNECYNAVFADGFEHTPTSVKEWKDDIAAGEISGDTLFVLKDPKAKIVAFLQLSHCLYDAQGKACGFIEVIGVRDAYRGRGLGTRLLKYGVGLLQSRYAVPNVRLHVDGANKHGALDIYRKNGFITTSMSVEYQYVHK